jgi:hypothetical protein
MFLDRGGSSAKDEPSSPFTRFGAIIAQRTGAFDLTTYRDRYRKHL